MREISNWFWKAPNARLALAGLTVLALLCAWGPAQAQQQGRVTGRLTGDPAKGSLEGATVVLLRFGAKADGKPSGGPVGRIVAGKDGSFAFENVPIDRKAMYQLGTRVDGGLIASKPFRFPPGKIEVRMDLPIPSLVSGFDGLRISQVLLVLEARVGTLWVTEILHLENPTTNIMSGSENPLELQLSPHAQDLEMIQMELQEGSHERVGGKLLLFGKARPGTTSVIFRYTLSTLLGSVRIEKSYALPVKEALLMVPVNEMEVSAKLLRPRGTRKIKDQTYSTWSAAELPPSAALRISVSGIPIRQWIFLIPLAGFLAVMAGVVLWFLRKRLGRAS
ncbi:MAG: hypothetical protein O7G32_13370 [SAR324 cluster bacterium]|nr:hypothetical protein [SAR324 cluster bacterium]